MSVELLCDRIIAAAREQSPLCIVGGHSKAFLGRENSDDECLSTSSLDKIIHYDPAELVLQVEAGVRIAEITELLRSKQQMLAFDPPDFSGQATIGGTIAAGCSGSRRPYAGAVRDFILGVGIIDGQGRQLKFGGQVMKNVAGYDVSRLMAGAFGCLGVITEASLKVLPAPESEQTTRLEMGRGDAVARMQALRRWPELSASAWYSGGLYVRLSGSESAVRQRLGTVGGEPVNDDFWPGLDNLEYLDLTSDCYRVSVAPTHPLGLAQASIIDWGGAQRWVQQQGFNALEFANDDTNISRIGGPDEHVTQPLSVVTGRIHGGLKRQFDPHNIFNPGRLYPGM